MARYEINVETGEVAEFPDLPVDPEMLVAQLPLTVSPRQIRQALARAGLRQQVEDAVAAGDQDLKDWWEFSTAFERSNAQVDAMSQALGVADEQVDQIWILGATL